MTILDDDVEAVGIAISTSELGNGNTFSCEEMGCMSGSEVNNLSALFLLD